MVFWLAAAVFAADRITKILVQRSMELFQSIPVLDGIFHITYIRNPGAAFGILANRTPLFIAITAAAIIGISLFARKTVNGSRLLKWGLGLQLGGALGNLYDRVLEGTVVDFLDFRIWPVFNVADSAVVVGVIILAYYVLFRMEPERDRA